MAAKKVALAAVTILLLASAGGGFLLLPALAPLHVWAARRSSPAEKGAWCLAVGLGLGMTSWAVVYRLVGESQPAIWLVPCACALIGALALAGIVNGGPERHAQ